MLFSSESVSVDGWAPFLRALMKQQILGAVRQLCVISLSETEAVWYLLQVLEGSDYGQTQVLFFAPSYQLMMTNFSGKKERNKMCINNKIKTISHKSFRFSCIFSSSFFPPFIFFFIPFNTLKWFWEISEKLQIYWVWPNGSNAYVSKRHNTFFSS